MQEVHTMVADALAVTILNYHDISNISSTLVSIKFVDHSDEVACRRCSK